MPPKSPRVFTVEEVDALIPELTVRVRMQLALGAEIEGFSGRLAKQPATSPGMAEPMSPIAEGSVQHRALREKLRDGMTRYEQGWREIQDLGAVIKDTRAGLLDFYGRLDGRLVWLCWRFGEERLEYFHELDVGFSGRQSLGNEIRHRVLN